MKAQRVRLSVAEYGIGGRDFINASGSISDATCVAGESPAGGSRKRPVKSDGNAGHDAPSMKNPQPKYFWRVLTIRRRCADIWRLSLRQAI